MFGLKSFEKSGSHIQDFANLILGALLFISPWALGYAGEAVAARTAWVGGIVIALIAVSEIVNFMEWEEWINLFVGLGVMAAPYLFGFTHVAHAVTAHYVLGLLVVASTAWELWSVHHPTPRMM